MFWKESTQSTSNPCLPKNQACCNRPISSLLDRPLKLIRVLHDIYQANLPKPWKLVKPTVIQFPVNDICNAGCQMCNIWQQKLGYQISAPELENALKNPLYSEVRTVGVNGGEPTLRKDLAELTEVLFTTLPKLEAISLITNALVHKKVINRLDEVGRTTKRLGGNFDVMVSLDGVGEVHNLVRGRKNNFENALKVLDYLKSTDLVRHIRLGCTVVRDNVYGLHDLHDLAVERDIYIKYRLAIPHKRLYSETLVEPYALNHEEMVHFCVFLENIILYYETSEHQKFFYRSLIDQILHNRARQAGCAWQHRGATITSKGELLYCAVKSRTLGSIVHEDSEKLYFANSNHLAEIVEHECANCMHDYVGLPPGPVLLGHLLKEAAIKTSIPRDWLDVGKLPQPVRQAGQKLRFSARLKQMGVQGTHRLPAMKIKKKEEAATASHILICGWYGTETLGDKAILAGVVNTLRQSLGTTSICLASLHPYISKATVAEMPELAGTEVVDIAEALQRIDSVDLVVFGGGPVMAIKNLADMMAIFETAAAHKTPTVLAGCGVGPLGSKYQNRIIKRLLMLASVRIYRDTKSLDHARSIGIDTRNDIIAEDPAFTWVAGKQKALATAPRSADSSVRVILGLRDWPYHQYAPEIPENRARAIKDRFEQQIVASLLDLSRQYDNLQIIPYPMCTNHYGGDDRWFYRRLFRAHRQLREITDYSVLSREQSPDEAFSIFRSADAALTMRFHSLVFAIGMNIPAVACDYTLGRGKVAALAEASDVPYRSIDNIDAGFIGHSIRAAITQRKQRDNLPEMCLPQFAQALDIALGRLR